MEVFGYLTHQPIINRLCCSRQQSLGGTLATIQYFVLSFFMPYLVQLIFALFVLLGLNWWMKPLSIQPRNPSLQRWKVLKLFIRVDASRSEGYQVDPNNSSALDTTPTVSPNLRHRASSQEPPSTNSDAVLLIGQRDATMSTSAALLANSDSEPAVQCNGEVSVSGTEDQSLELSEHSPTDHEEKNKLTSKERSL